MMPCMAYVSIAEAARRIGCTRQTAARIAVRMRIGIVVESGRVVAVKAADVAKMREDVQPQGRPKGKK